MPQNVTDWHRRQRKKELQKNKASRIAARDERVVQVKTESSISEEIRKLERQYKTIETRPHAIQSKLDRLQKELKLVRASVVGGETPQGAGQGTHSTGISTFQPLANPAVSVYYDPVLNPFGEPPPGRPKLFHRRGGGVTPYLEAACTLGEQFATIPPPPPLPPQVHSQPAPSSNGMRSENVSRKQSQLQQGQQKQQQSTTPRGDHFDSTKSSLGQHYCSHQQSNQGYACGVPLVNAPHNLPALPPPSNAVGRLKKRKLDVDIWASTEEIQYEENVGMGALEGVVSTIQEESGVIRQWWYRDTSDQVQGPYPTEQIIQWIKAGYFTDTTLLRPSTDVPWKPSRKLQTLASLLSSSSPTTSEKITHEVDDPATATKSTKSSLQDRIAASREERLDALKLVDEEKKEAAIGTNGREGESQGTVNLSGDDPVDAGCIETNPVATNRRPGVEFGVAAEEVISFEYQELDNDTSNIMYDDHIVCRNEDDDVDEDANSVQRRIAVLRQARINSELDMDVANHPRHSSDDSFDRSRSYECMAGPDQETERSMTANHPIEYPNTADSVPPYPVDEQSFGVPYPVDTDEPPAYPLDAVGEDLAYPVKNAYSSFELGAIDDFPVTGDYPIEEERNSPSMQPDGSCEKKPK